MAASSTAIGDKRQGAMDMADWHGERLIPSRVVIETVFGCNARCPMCLIEHMTERGKGVMSMEKFETLVDRLVPYRNQITMLDLFGLGEPLLDRFLPKRVALLKNRGFTGVAVSTNAHLLDLEWRRQLLAGGVDTILVSIDGATRAVHETARPRTNFDRVVSNVEAAIRERDTGNYKTRFVIRFIQQKHNAQEWEAYRAFWKSRINEKRNDLVLRYHMHDWSGQTGGDAARIENNDPFATQPCHHLFEKLVILANGKVALCFEDLLDGKYGFGNAFDTDPIDLFNAKPLNKLRELHSAGKKSQHKLCGHCTVLATEAGRVQG
jgi:sulfatase maturation enzyme AslB (radical SAM superfamily)